MSQEAYFNQYIGNLKADISAVATTCLVAPVPSGPAATDHWRLRMTAELVEVTHTTDNGDGTATLTITRGAEGTTAASHLNGQTVRSVLTGSAVANLLTVEELDGSPSLEGVRKIVVPGGSLSISGTTATIKAGGWSPLTDGNSNLIFAGGDVVDVPFFG